MGFRKAVNISHTALMQLFVALIALIKGIKHFSTGCREICENAKRFSKRQQKNVLKLYFFKDLHKFFY
jgi:hypothetical protein